MAIVKKTTRSRAAKPQKKASRPRAAKPGPGVTETLSSVVQAAFKDDDNVRAAVSQRLAARAPESRALAMRANAAFANFQPTVFTRAERVRRNYLAPGENLARAMHAVAEKGVAAMRESADQRTLSLNVGGELKALVTPGPGGGAARRIGLGDLLKYLGRKLADAPTLRNDPTRTACDAEARANEALAKIEGNGAGGALPTPPTPPVTPGAAADGAASRVKEFVRSHVDDLLAKVVSPEDQLRFDVEKRATLADTEAGVGTFQLRAGASDVTSYHDFRSLQIAFEHVWTELFDGRLKSLGSQLYHEAAQLETFLRPAGTTNLNFAITSIPDLLALLRDIRELSSQAAGSMPDTGGTASDYVTVLTGVENGVPMTRQVAVIPGATRLSRLLDEIELRLKERYSFAVFAKDSYNFGILVTYRQTWRPEKYQVGDLVSTIPLAPRETRRYTTRRVVKKTRAAKEIEDALRTTSSDTSGTSRVEREIVDKAQNKTNFDLTVHDTLGSEGYKTDFTGKVGGEQATQSKKAKTHFHEAVLKSAEEYKQQHRLEIDTTATEETEETTFHEIQNPNDELTVTYMLYELQRTYRVSEKIHQLTPVILVANEVPAPDAIDDAWLIANDWVLRRVILDDSFKPALEYLTKSFVGAELNIRILDSNAKGQKQVVDKLNQQIALQTGRLEGDEKKLADTVKGHADAQEAQGVVNSIKRIFDPLGITGKEGEGTVGARATMVDYLQETFDRSEREKARLLEQLGVATTALQGAVDKLSAATKEHYDRIAEIDRLRIHVKANILYYMQAIWSHEPPDQRFFRVYNIDVDIVEPDTSGVAVALRPLPPRARDVLEGRATTGATLVIPPVTTTRKKLVEVADLDTVLGYKGNYAIYALSENNYITLHMMQDYLDVAEDVKLRDPDEFGDYTVDDLQKLAECMYRRNPTAYAKYRKDLKDLIIQRLTSGRPEDDRVIVPTDSLYIEALVGTHPLLEDFKLIHRALDVKKVQAEVRHAELENIRLAARALKGKDGDPDIEKKIVIETDTGAVTVQPDTN